MLPLYFRDEAKMSTRLDSYFHRFLSLKFHSSSRVWRWLWRACRGAAFIVYCVCRFMIKVVDLHAGSLFPQHHWQTDAKIIHFSLAEQRNPPSLLKYSTASVHRDRLFIRTNLIIHKIVHIINISFFKKIRVLKWCQWKDVSCSFWRRSQRFRGKSLIINRVKMTNHLCIGIFE